MAKHESLRKGYQNSIDSAKSLYDWVSKKATNIEVAYVGQSEYEEEQKKLHKRYDQDKPKTIKETRKFHSFTPLANFKLNVKRISNSNSSYTLSIK